MAVLSVNVDHVATVREARRDVEPDPVQAAAAVQAAGAAGVTVHLREDRRHIQDHDVLRIAAEISLPLNFEMAATPEMVAFALELRPHSAMLVPEGRQEITTEGGLDVAGDESALRDTVATLSEAGIPASAFLDAHPRQIEAAARCGFAVCEIHTGPWAEVVAQKGLQSDAAQAELERVEQAGAAIHNSGMRFNAGHALNYHNVGPIAALHHLCELHIGHSIVARSISTGMQAAVSEMMGLIEANTQ